MVRNIFTKSGFLYFLLLTAIIFTGASCCSSQLKPFYVSKMEATKPNIHTLSMKFHQKERIKIRKIVYLLGITNF